MQWPYAMYCIRKIQNSGIFMHIETLRDTQAYSGIFRTLCNRRIFIALPYSETYFEPVAYLKLCKTLTRHIQNLAIGRYSAIFRNIQNLAQRLHTQKPGIRGILEYSEPFHHCILTHIQNSVILANIYKYSELWYI